MTKALLAVPAVFVVLDFAVRLIPVPTTFAIFIKLPTALFCVAAVVFTTAPRSKTAALRYVGAGTVCLALYLFLAPLLLHHDPRYQERGEYVANGLWLSPAASTQVAAGETVEALRQEHSPHDWVLLYPMTSQLATAVLLFALYVPAFVCLAQAFRYRSLTPARQRPTSEARLKSKKQL